MPERSYQVLNLVSDSNSDSEVFDSTAMLRTKIRAKSKALDNKHRLIVVQSKKGSPIPATTAEDIEGHTCQTSASLIQTLQPRIIAVVPFDVDIEKYADAELCAKPSNVFELTKVQELDEWKEFQGPGEQSLQDAQDKPIRRWKPRSAVLVSHNRFLRRPRYPGNFRNKNGSLSSAVHGVGISITGWLSYISKISFARRLHLTDYP